MEMERAKIEQTRLQGKIGLKGTFGNANEILERNFPPIYNRIMVINSTEEERRTLGASGRGGQDRKKGVRVMARL